MAATCEMRESHAAEEEENRRDWGSALPSLVVASVAERLTIVEFLQMSLVCKPWSSVLTHRRRQRRQQQQPAVPVLPRRLQFPWLMVPAEHTSVRTPTRTFFSLPDGRSYHLTDPVLSGKHVIASDKGWLILSDQQQWVLSLLQPITGDHILLPSLFTIHELVVDSRDPSSGSIVEFCYRYPETGSLSGPFTLEECHHGMISKVVLSSSPSDGRDFVVVVVIQKLYMYFARPGDSAWTGVEKMTDKFYYFPDILFVDRHNLFGLTGELDVINVDFRGKKPRHTILERTNGPRGHVDCYLASCAGDLFVVSRHKKEATTILDVPGALAQEITECALLYELVQGDDGERCWVETKDLKGHALFIGTNNCICLMAKDVPGLKENCIYFTDDDTDYIIGEDGKQSARDVVVWDLEEETCEPIYYPDNYLTYPPPKWFMPSLH